MKIFSYLALIFFARNVASFKERIVGGYEVSIEKIPFQVALVYYKQFRCGGSIISRNYILTAAHCTLDIFDLSSLKIRSGSSDSTTGGSLHDVSRIDIHPKYDQFLYDYDASILKLRTIINFDKYRQPIQLPHLNEAIPEGSYVSTSGWGSTQNVKEEGLRMVELRIINQAVCSMAYIKDGGVTTRMVCAAALTKDACDGDSGGPLVDIKSGKLVGIVSFGPRIGCAIDNIPGVYARVASIRPWIRQVTFF